MGLNSIVLSKRNQVQRDPFDSICGKKKKKIRAVAACGVWRDGRWKGLTWIELTDIWGIWQYSVL